MTVEDPIEYDIEGIGQTQVNPKIDMTFAKALRAILRQDPDVVMIGEIRDLETAQIAVQASLTGHLVLATLHTNDAASAVTRLIDMGIEPFLLSSSLLGVMGQRLVRKLCPKCRMQDSPTSAVARGRLRQLRQHRLCRPHRHLRIADRRRRDAHAGAPGRQRHRHSARRREAAAWSTCAPTPSAGSSPASPRRKKRCESRANDSRNALWLLNAMAPRLPLYSRRAPGRSEARRAIQAATSARAIRRVAYTRSALDGCIQIRRGGHVRQGADRRTRGRQRAGRAAAAARARTDSADRRSRCYDEVASGPACRCDSAGGCRRPNSRSSRASSPRCWVRSCRSPMR